MATTEHSLGIESNKNTAAVRDTQDALMDRMDGYEAAVLVLTEVVAKNHEMILENRRLIMENRALIMENRELIIENRNAINEINRKVDYHDGEY